MLGSRKESALSASTFPMGSRLLRRCVSLVPWCSPVQGLWLRVSVNLLHPVLNRGWACKLFHGVCHHLHRPLVGFNGKGFHQFRHLAWPIGLLLLCWSKPTVTIGSRVPCATPP